MRATDQELALKPWLYRIAHNAALNILRASKDEDEVLDAERAGAVQTADVVELREQLRETLASIQALPAAQRDALLLREIEGRSHEEIAAALGVTAGGARQHLHRARMSLRAAASAITPYPVLARVLNAGRRRRRAQCGSGVRRRHGRRRRRDQGRRRRARRGRDRRRRGHGAAPLVRQVEQARWRRHR